MSGHLDAVPLPVKMAEALTRAVRKQYDPLGLLTARGKDASESR